MTDRLIDISEQAARLSVRLDQLVIRLGPDDEPVTTPLAEIAALAVSHPQVSYSHAVLAGLARHGAALVVCDEKHLPCGLFLPLAGHSVQAERFARQAEAGEPLRKRLWRQIVRAKITAQGRLLQELHAHDQGLGQLAKTVRSGDPDNLEAQAARRYWPALFGDPSFVCPGPGRRRPEPGA